MKNVDVIHVTKSLVSILSDREVTVGSGKDTIGIKYICRGDGIEIKPDSPWLGVVSTSTVQGRGDSYDTVIVNVAIAGNTGAERTGKVVLSSSKAGWTSSDSVVVNQNGIATCYASLFGDVRRKDD